MLSNSQHRRDSTSATRTDALCFGQHSYGRPNVISRAIVYAKLFSRSHRAFIRDHYVTLNEACLLGRPNYRRQRGDRIPARYDSSGMKKTIYLLAMLGLFAACEQKTTTVNPPDKKESNTTIVNPPGSSTTTTKEEKKTDINVNTSPNP